VSRLPGNWHHAGRRAWCLSACGWVVGSAVAAPPAATSETVLRTWTERFAREVDRRLEVPLADQQSYIGLLEQALRAEAVITDKLTDKSQAQLTPRWMDRLADKPAPLKPAQAYLLVDRSEHVQAAMIVVRTEAGGWHWLGATAVSTGQPGRYEHFYTPLGVFAHTLRNPDYRAEGTFNSNHIRGYGLRGRRVFDFGWQEAERGWGKGGTSSMRLQMHATDPQRLEPRLGQWASEGCVRIPAALNVFLDVRGVLDADYEAAVARGQKLWVLNPKREPVPWPGQSMVVVDSQAAVRPAWAPLPGQRAVAAI
jgi:hypothetical protein